MTKKYTQQEIDEAFDGIEEIRGTVNGQNKFPLHLGKLVCEAKKFDYFAKNGIDIKDFCGEIRISYKTIYGYEGVYKAFCLSAGHEMDDLGEIPITRLLKLKPALFKGRKGLPKLKVEKEELENWVEKSKILSTTDFNIEFNQCFKNLKDPSQCKHEHAKTHAYMSCPDCGERIWVDPETKEPIKHWH